LVIYFFLFIFVRILEGKADLKTKEVGYANELVKALYNLESFYATGREIGFNTMLLCEEKITKDNQLLDYMSTAKYLNRSMIKPSRASLLATFIHSHPPSYYRIAALLGNKLKPGKEAILPFICLKRSKQKKYAMKFEQAREKFKIIAKEKFKEYFEINNIPLLMEKIRRKELHQFDLQKDYIFRNLITDEIILGKLMHLVYIIYSGVLSVLKGFTPIRNLKNWYGRWVLKRLELVGFWLSLRTSKSGRLCWRIQRKLRVLWKLKLNADYAGEFGIQMHLMCNRRDGADTAQG